VISESRPPLKLDIVCRDIGPGGAARATRRLVETLWSRKDDGVDVSLLTRDGRQENARHRSGLPGGPARGVRALSRQVSSLTGGLPTHVGNRILHSRADVWTGLGQDLNRRLPDVINLHWLGNDTISIEEIGRLRSPVVATLHDMWFINGAAHFATDGRYRDGYTKESRPAGDSGIDWDRRTWLRKSRHWRRPFRIITPSRWLARCVEESPLNDSWTTSVIPNPIDTRFWAPLDRRASRSLLGVPEDAVLILFGASGGEAQPIKGADLLRAAVWELPSRVTAEIASRLLLGLFGSKSPPGENGEAASGRLPFPLHNFGRVSDDRILRAIYAAADVVVVPSRVDNLPQTAIEASCCGIPVVAFNVGGLPDIVEDRVTGRLAVPFDTSELASAVAWVLEDEARKEALGRRARDLAVARFDAGIVIDAYLDVLRSAALIGK